MTTNNDDSLFPRYKLYDDAIISGQRTKPAVPIYASLLSLIFYLFLEVSDDEDRIESVGIVFSPEYDPGTFSKRTDPRSFDDFLDALKKETVEYEFYKTALSAMRDGEIEVHQVDYGPPPMALEALPDDQNVYTVSFLLWAEKQGYKIPESIVEETKEFLDFYVRHQQNQRAEKENFPEISDDEFAKLTNEPLWTVANAILYILGHKSETTGSLIKGFVSNRRVTKKIIEYLKDAASIGDLILVGDFESDEELLLNTKVKPKEFIDWIEILPLDLPFPNLTKESVKLADHAISNERTIPREVLDTELTERERQTLLKLIAAMAIRGYKFDQTAKRNEATRDIQNDLDHLGISLDQKTILKWLREACSLIPNEDP